MEPESKVVQARELLRWMREQIEDDQWIKVVHDGAGEFGIDRLVLHFFPPEMIHEGVPCLTPAPVTAGHAEPEAVTEHEAAVSPKVDQDAARTMGYTGNPCPDCGGWRVRFVGKCPYCDDCKKSVGGCS